MSGVLPDVFDKMLEEVLDRAAICSVVEQVDVECTEKVSFLNSMRDIQSFRLIVLSLIGSGALAGYQTGTDATREALLNHQPSLN